MSRLTEQIIRIVSAERIDGSNCRVLCKYSVDPARAMTVSKKKEGDGKRRERNGARLIRGIGRGGREEGWLNWFGLHPSSLQRAVVIISVPNVAIAFDPAANHRKPMRAVSKEGRPGSSKCRDGILKETQRKRNPPSGPERISSGNGNALTRCTRGANLILVITIKRG